jgi:hypothetical protein
MWTKEQQKEHRKLWIDALRSGDYKQATSQLRYEDGFCCLGVACDLWMKSGDAPKFVQWEGEYFVYRELEDGEDPDSTRNQISNILPDEVRDWLGLRTNCGYYGPYPTVALTSVNDSGTDFNEIADIIETEPEGLINDA